VRLLLVDDDRGLRELLRTTFEVVDVELDEAADAMEAEAVIASRRPDIVVLDVGMPGMDGLAFCRRLKEDRARSRSSSSPERTAARRPRPTAPARMRSSASRSARSSSSPSSSGWPSASPRRRR
jgi:CheY-like chemotaxis protein